MTAKNQLTLDNQICFALYSTSLAMTQLYKEYLQPIGLTYPQYIIMLILWEEDGVSLKHIADRLNIKSGSLTPVIKRLEADKLIKRVRGNGDERMLSICLTDAGSNLKSQALNINKCIAEACGINESDLNELRNQLTVLRQNLQR